MRRINRWILVGLVLVGLILSPVRLVAAQSGDPTSGATVTEMQPTNGLPWYVGVLLLIAVFVALTVYKNRYQASRKKPVLNASCCVPIIEDGENPFHPVEDEPEKKE